MDEELFKGKGKRKAEIKEKEKEEERADWSNLAADTLELIIDQLAIDIFDYIRFRGVCKAWHSSNLYKHPPQLPWLLSRYDDDINRLTFCSLSDNKLHSIQLPINDRDIIGSYDGWLILHHKTSVLVTILNPLTSAHIDLPMLPSDFRYLGPPSLKFAMSSNPSIKDQQCIICILYTPGNFLLYIRVGEDDEWTLVERTTLYYDIIYFKGSFFTVSDKGQIFMFNSLFEEVAIIDHQSEIIDPFWEFVELSGELLILQNIMIRDPDDYGIKNLMVFVTKKIEIQKLNMRGLLPSLEEVKSIGNHILFFGINSRSITVPVTQYPREKYDTIYTPHIYMMSSDEQNVYCRIEIYDLKNASLRPIPHDELEKMCTDILPMWFVPSLF